MPQNLDVLRYRAANRRCKRCKADLLRTMIPPSSGHEARYMATSIMTAGKSAYGVVDVIGNIIILAELSSGFESRRLHKEGKMEDKKDEKDSKVVEKDGKHYVVVKPNFMEKAMYDVDGNQLTEEEVQEYWDDVFDGGIPMSPGYAKDYLWPKWGKRLGIPEPK